MAPMITISRLLVVIQAGVRSCLVLIQGQLLKLKMLPNQITLGVVWRGRNEIVASDYHNYIYLSFR